jgi:quercetin dioxygenase-like cupin family protein
VSGGEFIENPATGERITFLVSTPELLVMHAVWPRPGHRTVEHAHPAMEERFTVLTGSVGLRVGGREMMLAEGESATAPAGVSHLAWNPSSEAVEVRLEMRPACRWEQFTRRLFAGEDPRRLLGEYEQEVSIPAAR